MSRKRRPLRDIIALALGCLALPAPQLAQAAPLDAGPPAPAGAVAPPLGLPLQLAWSWPWAPDGPPSPPPPAAEAPASSPWRLALGLPHGGPQAPPLALQLSGLAWLWPSEAGLVFNDPGRWVRRLRPDGQLEALAGGALYDGAAGLKGPAVGGLGLPAATGPIGQDASGRLILVGPLTMLAVGPEGAVSVLWPMASGQRILGAWLNEAGAPELVKQDAEGLSWWRLEGSGWRQVKALSKALATLILACEPDAGRGPLGLRGGRRGEEWILRWRRQPGQAPVLLRVHLARSGATLAPAGPAAPQLVAPGGWAFALTKVGEGQSLWCWAPGAPPEAVAQGLPAGWSLYAAAVGPDGRTWAALGPSARSQAIVRAQGGAWSLVAGRLQGAVGRPEALDLALAGAAFSPDGALVVASRHPAQVLRLPPGGGPALALAALPPEADPRGLAIAPQGVVMANDAGRRLWRIDAQGAQVAYRVPEGLSCQHLSADGPLGFAAWLVPTPGASGPGQILRLDARGARSYLAPPKGRPQGLACDALGGLWAASWGASGLDVQGWPRLGGRLLSQHWEGLAPPATGPEGGLLVDARQRFILAAAASGSAWRRRVLRLGAEVETLAGPGGPGLGGAGLDEGLREVEALALGPQGELAIATPERVFVGRP